MKVTYLDQHLKHSEFNGAMNCDLPVQKDFKLQFTASLPPVLKSKLLMVPSPCNISILKASWSTRNTQNWEMAKEYKKEPLDQHSLAVYLLRLESSVVKGLFPAGKGTLIQSAPG